MHFVQLEEKCMSVSHVEWGGPGSDSNWPGNMGHFPKTNLAPEGTGLAPIGPRGAPWSTGPNDDSQY